MSAPSPPPAPTAEEAPEQTTKTRYGYSLDISKLEVAITVEILLSLLRVGIFEVCVPTHYVFSLRRFWPVNCIKIGRHFTLLSDPTVYYSACRRRGGVLKCPRFCFFFVFFWVFFGVESSAAADGLYR